MTAHPDALIVAAFLDDTLDATARTALLQHLAECAECRAEVGDVRRLLPTRHVSRRVWQWGALAAAAVMLVWVAPAFAPVATPRTVIERDSDRERADISVPEIETELAVVSDSVKVNAAGATLVWRHAGQGATYEVMIQDETGGVRYNTRSGDTTAYIPRAALGAGGRLYWRIHAYLLDGSERSSGAHVLLVN